DDNRDAPRKHHRECDANAVTSAPMHPLAEAPTPYVELDHELRCVYANPAAALLAGKSVAELEGRGVDEVAGARAAAAIEPALRSVLGDAGQAQRFIVDGDGGRQFRAAVMPVRGPDGAIVGAGCILGEIEREAALGWQMLMATRVLGVVGWREDG